MCLVLGTSPRVIRLANLTKNIIAPYRHVSTRFSSLKQAIRDHFNLIEEFFLIARRVFALHHHRENK